MAAPACVFVVDDDPVQLLILEATLRTAGHMVEVFDRPEALLDRLSPDDRGCVVMDLQMPGLNGLALQQALAGRGADLPVLFVSGSADIPDAVAAMKGAAIASTATVHRAGRYCNGLPAVTVHDTLEACREVS